jgi:glucose-6-phosphate 1-dehydrogenase
MLALTALEPPVSFAADSVRDEIVKVLRAVRPFTAEDLRGALVRGQYAAGEVGGKAVPAYRAEKGVAPESRTETYVAAKLGIDNWRWKGVPFYLRAGKRLPRRVSEIAIAFKSVPHSIFIPLLPEHLSPNVLVLNVQPDEGVALTIQAKQPGAKLCVGDLTMRFNYREVFGGEPPDAYERLLLDCMLGDQTLFLRQDAIEVSWSLLDPVLDAWSRGGEEERAGALHSYRAGTWGPEEAEALLGRDGRQWREP